MDIFKVFEYNVTDNIGDLPKYIIAFLIYLYIFLTSAVRIVSELDSPICKPMYTLPANTQVFKRQSLFKSMWLIWSLHQEILRVPHDLKITVSKEFFSYFIPRKEKEERKNPHCHTKHFLYFIPLKKNMLP